MFFSLRNGYHLESESVDVPAGKVSGKVRISFVTGDRGRVFTDNGEFITIRGVEYGTNVWFERGDNGEWTTQTGPGMVSVLRVSNAESATTANRKLVSDVFAALIAAAGTPHVLARADKVAADREYDVAEEDSHAAYKAYQAAQKLEERARQRKLAAHKALDLLGPERPHVWLPAVDGFRTCKRLNCYAQWEFRRKSEPKRECNGTDSE